MKFYVADQNVSVNSSAREPELVDVPVFYFKGSLKAGMSGKWYPQENITVIAGYATSMEFGLGTAGLAVLKNNVFEQNIPVATVILQPNDKKEILTLVDPLSGGVDLTPYDYLTVASVASSGHKDVTVSIMAVKKQ